MTEYLIVIIVTLLALLPLLLAMAYRVGRSRAIRRMTEARRWEHWIIRNESQRNVRFWEA